MTTVSVSVSNLVLLNTELESELLLETGRVESCERSELVWLKTRVDESCKSCNVSWVEDNGEVLEVSKLKEKAKEFILNPANSEELPEKEVGSFGSFGNVMYTKKHVISLQNDRGTQYQAYIEVQNALVAAYDEIRDDFSMQKRGKKFVDLTEDEQKEVQKIYPQKISEAEPKNYGGN